MKILFNMYKATLLISCFFCTYIIYGQIPAFPGAEGFGRFATGGRGGDVYHVTNLNNEGKGSLRYGIEKMKGSRTIVFDVSGTIMLNDRLKVEDSNLTIAGQTAPGDGITLGGHAFYIDASDVIVRHIRCRYGDVSGGQHDAISIIGGSNIIIDHVSASWSVDETLSCQSEYVDSLTVQWCMITESLRYSNHNKGAHGYGGIIGALRQSFHHNLYAHHSSRSPKVTWRRHCEVDFRNNVIYNWGYNNCYDGTASYMNWVNNYYKAGPGTESDVRDRIFNLSDEDKGNYQSYETSLYAEGNYVDGYPAVTADNWNGGIDFDNGASEAKNRAHSPFDFPAITEQTAEESYPLVLENAGASLIRDEIDERIVDEVLTGTVTYGNDGIIDSQNDVGGWPELYSLPAPADSDADGMPDYWEDQFGLNKADQTDNMVDKDRDIYVNLEEYINNTDPSGGDLPIVYVRSLDSRAHEEAGESGDFTIYRAGNMISPLTVNYTISGTATAGNDYSVLSETATIEAGKASTKITITPFQDDEAEDVELVVITLNAGENGYNVGCPNASLVAINDSPSSVDINRRDDELTPDYFVLEQNYPNPFNSSTQINFYLPTDQYVSLKIYDINGRYITTLIESELKIGIHQIQWNGMDTRVNNMTSGIYFARLFSVDYISTLKLQLLK